MHLERVNSYRRFPFELKNPRVVKLGEGLSRPSRENALKMDGNGHLFGSLGRAVEISRAMGGSSGGGNPPGDIPLRIAAVLKELVRRNCAIETLIGVEKALIFAMQAFEGQFRHSGDPAFVHALDVLEILLYELNIVDKRTLQAGILHDVIEDTPFFEQLKQQYDQDVVGLVDALTKIPKTHFENQGLRFERNRRKLFLLSTGDFRIPVIKLADRLANMRTLHYVKNELDRQRIADETFKYFVPLADVLGIWSVKRQLEDLSFMHLLPESYMAVKTFLDQSSRARQRKMAHFQGILRHLVKKGGVEILRFTHKPRTIFSINEEIKQFRLNTRFRGKLKQLFAAFYEVKPLLDFDTFNIVVKDEDDCYKAMALLQRAFHIPDEKIKDFIKAPKPNFYMSLNAEIDIPGFGRVRIKIRTEEMEAVADRGIVALIMEQGKPLPGYWRRLVQSWEVGVKESSNLNSDIQRYLKPITVFTPRGDAIVLSGGSTALDLAFRIHTEKVGLRAVGAVIDGKRASLATRLKDGQRVEIVTTDTDIAAKRDLWFRLISHVDGEARRRIRKFLEERPADENIQFGKTLIKGFVKARGGMSYQALLEGMAEGKPDLALHITRLRHDARTKPLRPLEDLDDIYWYVGTLNLDPLQVIKRFFAAP